MNRMLFAGLSLVAVCAAPLFGQGKVDDAAYAKMIEKAVGFLQSAQTPDGAYSPNMGPGATALITTALLRQGRAPNDPLVAKSLKYLEGFVRDDGGIAKDKSRLPNYETCLAVLCFKEANRDGKYDAILKKADAWLRGAQYDEADGKKVSDEDYGGAGYGGTGRPDLSNTGFLIDALKASGTPEDDEAIKKALIFVSRCQNLETELTVNKNALKDPDGGFFYSVAGEGSSAAGKSDEGALRSYGAMTYTGLKSMIYAGLKADDKRVQAATKWLKKNYSVEQNPGMGQAGVYYYYNTFAKALDTLGGDTFEDEKGVKHNWREELIAELAKRQAENGSWSNTDKRWMEGDANLSTGFALLALSYAKPKAK